VAKTAIRNLTFDPRITRHRSPPGRRNVRTLIDQKKLRRGVAVAAGDGAANFERW